MGRAEAPLELHKADRLCRVYTERWKWQNAFWERCLEEQKGAPGFKSDQIAERSVGVAELWAPVELHVCRDNQARVSSLCGRGPPVGGCGGRGKGQEKAKNLNESMHRSSQSWAVAKECMHFRISELDRVPVTWGGAFALAQARPLHAVGRKSLPEGSLAQNRTSGRSPEHSPLRPPSTQCDIAGFGTSDEEWVQFRPSS